MPPLAIARATSLPARPSGAAARVVARTVLVALGVSVAIGVARVLARVARRLGIAAGVRGHLVALFLRSDGVAPLLQRLAGSGGGVCVSHSRSSMHGIGRPVGGKDRAPA